MKSYKFGVRLYCGFGGHNYTPHDMFWGKMTASLYCESNKNDENVPIAYTWYPEDVSDEQKVEQQITLSADLKWDPIF